MGFKLYRLEADSFAIITRLGNAKPECVVGNLNKTIRTLLNFGIENQEIEAGLVSLVANDHAVADYGVNGTFIYSKPKA